MYALIRNNQIKVGPRDWRYHFFKRYLDSNNLDSSALPMLEPLDGKIITQEWKIIPVIEVVAPSYDQDFEQLAGPYWTLYDEYIVGRYNIAYRPIDSIKNNLKQVVTDTRYRKEVSGCPFTFLNGTRVNLYTTREDRNVYLQAYQIMSDDQSIMFKFEGAVFKSVTRDELWAMIMTGASHIQAAFDWEAQKYTEIDACNTIDELRAIDITIAV